MSPLVLCDFPTARLIFCWIGLISVFLTLVIGWFIAFGIQGQLLNSVVVSEILSIFFFGKFYLSVTIGNISPVIGFIIAAAVLCSINDKLISAFFLLLLAGLLKITPIFLIFPVFVTLKKTKITFLIILLACAASSFYLVSMSLWQEFFVKILPTLGKTWLDKNCKSTSIFGFVSDFFQ